MDLQLDYIVGQTEKYSSWLTEGLNLAPSSTSTSVQGSMPSSPRSEGDTSAITGDGKLTLHYIFHFVSVSKFLILLISGPE